jgi:hypothetical protein
MYLTMFENVEKAVAQRLIIDPDSLYSAFDQVTDGRKKKGKRYPLPLLLTLLLLGKLAGETTVNGIVDSCERTTRVAARTIAVAEAVSDQFHVE